MAQQTQDKITKDLDREVARRRTFAIISHPDAGKTTLTEKLLLYAGAVELAGAVRARRNQRHATSDWMAMEQERGISVTASALEMEYNGYRINLLDTPGHQDFSEDTYRTLMAVDSAVMVLDSAKGIEPQTEKLFHVCRMRGIPIMTFVNKMDHPGRDPLDLLDEIERVLGISAVPLNWPIDSGYTFQGVYDLAGRRVLRFQRTEHGQRRTPVITADLYDTELAEALGERSCQELREQVELLEAVGASFDRHRFLRGELTPVFFGSALNNFGVETFLEALLKLAPPPGSRESDRGLVYPGDEAFSGFIFKIQANMDPRHRDRMAFLRICSGRFHKDMVVENPRLGRKVRLSRAYRIFARERETIEDAYPGDVIGIINPGLFVIGDTLTAGNTLQFQPMPRFSPEHFGILRNQEVTRYKQFYKGLVQLEEEGAVQVFFEMGNARREPILAAVGELQFDVAVARLRDEYGVYARVERLPHVSARWIEANQAELGRISWPTRGVMRCQDRDGFLVALFDSDWRLNYFRNENPHLVLKEVSDISPISPSPQEVSNVDTG
jgi:peptide chain release factor 3